MHVHALFDLSGKVALVTGGSRGLGLEIARGLAEAGAQVAITARRQQWLKEAEEELKARGISPLVLSCDVSRSDQVAETVDRALKTFGRIDVLVNAAGIAWGEPAESMRLEKWEQVMATNATGCFLMCQSVGRSMIQARRSGTIVNIASYVAQFGTDPDILDAVGYSASKGAVVSLTRDLAVKWARHGIRVNAIAPGYFDTRLSSGVLAHARERIEKATPMGRIGGQGEIKGVALFLVSAASAYVTGHVVAVDGGMTAV